MRNLSVAAVLIACCTMFSGSTSALTVCNNIEYRQFDFWLGTWHARLPSGKTIGTNHIEREYEGCVIHERFTGDRNYGGESLNIYDAARKVWHQTWVDNTGTLLILEGSLHDGRMIMEGQTTGIHGVIRSRITWTPNADGSVRQFWESADEKGQWKVAMDTLFTKN
ncbi:MAG: hypothetical protein ABUL58_03010 [Steroidobacter sp.]